MEKSVELMPYQYHRKVFYGSILIMIFIAFILFKNLHVNDMTFIQGFIVVISMIIALFCSALFLGFLFFTSNIKLTFANNELDYKSKLRTVRFMTGDISYAYYYHTLKENILILSPYMLEKREMIALVNRRMLLWKYWKMLMEPQRGEPVVISLTIGEIRKWDEFFDYIYEMYGIKP